MSRIAARVCHLAVVTVAATLVAGCPDLQAALETPIDVAAGLQAEWIVYPAESPSALAFADDGRVFYTEKNTGRIRVIANGTLLEQPFAELPVNFANDAGLLGIALHPQFNITHRVYVFYTRSDTGAPSNNAAAVVDHRIVYFDATNNVASGGEIFVASMPASGDGKRIGGRIAFAGDGTLFVALGDLGTITSAQDETRRAGKVLRYNDDGSIPANNPIADSPVYARGLRDPAGLTFDPQSGAFFLIDRNLLGYNEINRIEPGRDYGWPVVTGFANTTAELEYVAQHAEYMDPLFDTGLDADVLVGAGFNPSTKYGADTLLDFFYGRAGDGRVYVAQLSGGRDSLVQSQTFAHGFPTALRDIAFTPAGTLYVASDNAILRVVTYAP